MSQYYSDESRANDKWSLPDLEVFHADAGELEWEGMEGPSEAGWYYWTCLPGCTPDSDPYGPFDTEAEALKAARDSAG